MPGAPQTPLKDSAGGDGQEAAATASPRAAGGKEREKRAFPTAGFGVSEEGGGAAGGKKSR